jgi:hypothetical protein
MVQLTETEQETPVLPSPDAGAWLREVGAGRPEAELELLARVWPTMARCTSIEVWLGIMPRRS